MIIERERVSFTLPKPINIEYFEGEQKIRCKYFKCETRTVTKFQREPVGDRERQKHLHIVFLHWGWVPTLGFQFRMSCEQQHKKSMNCWMNEHWAWTHSN